MKEYNAKTVDDAVKLASEELGIAEDEVIFTIKEEKTGLLSKKAVIVVYELSDAIEFAEEYIKNVTGYSLASYKQYLKTQLIAQQYVMQPGDVFVTNCAMFDGLVGHAAIAISHDKILHIGGIGEHPSVMSLAEWNEHYSSESGTWTKVYRISNPAKAAVAANWAERTYVGSKAEYSFTLNKASTDCTYCSKLVWQALC